MLPSHQRWTIRLQRKGRPLNAELFIGSFEEVRNRLRALFQAGLADSVRLELGMAFSATFCEEDLSL